MHSALFLLRPLSVESGRFWGSRRFLGLPLRAEIRIPAPEGILPLFVEHPSSYLQEKMCSTLAPSHLLFLHHPFAHDLIDCRLDEPGSDLFPIAIAFPVIGHEFPVTLHVRVQVLDAFQEFSSVLILALEGCRV